MSAADDDACYTLDGWNDAGNVARWLGLPVTAAESQPLGPGISGAMTRELDVTLLASSAAGGGDDGAGADAATTARRFVLKIGRHAKGLGRYREADFYARFAPKGATGTNTNIVGSDNTISEQAPKSPESAAFASAIAQYIPRCHFCRYTCTDTHDLSAIVLEKLAGVDSGLFFGRHSPLNWRFASDDAIAAEKTRQYLDAGVTELSVCLETAALAARLHGPFWGKVPQLLADPNFEHAACREWYAIAAAAATTTPTAPAAATSPPKSWTDALSYSLNLWSAEKQRIVASGAATTTGTDPDDAATATTPFGFSQLVTDCVDAAFARTTWPNVLQHIRAVPSTWVHGDFHPANMLVLGPGAAGMRVVDFEMHRIGSGPQELGQVLISHARPASRRQCERAMLERYVAVLRDEFGVEEGGGVDLASVTAEYVAGGLGRFLWFLPILASLGQGDAFAMYFHDQVLAFLGDHGVTPANVPLMRV